MYCSYCFYYLVDLLFLLLFSYNYINTIIIQCRMIVNWPKLLGPFQNVFTTFFDVYVFGMSFYIISGTKK